MDIIAFVSVIWINLEILHWADTIIKTVALLHQFQRDKDEYGRIIAEMQDYAIAYQLMKDAFLEDKRK